MEISGSQSSWGRFLGPASLAVAGCCFLVRLMTGGWFILVGWIVYTPVCVFHAALHWHASRSPSQRVVNMAVISNVLLILAFLLQWDIGDGLGWLTITALLGGGPGSPDSAPPSWWLKDQDVLLLTDLLLFVPVIISWIILGKAVQGGQWRNKVKGAALILALAAVGGVVGYFGGALCGTITMLWLVWFTAFLGSLIGAMLAMWILYRRSIGDPTDIAAIALAALNRCDGCGTTFTSFYGLEKVEGRGFLCAKCRSGSPAATS